MELFTDVKKLTEKFIQLSEQYKYIAFATAWATSQHPAFQKLLEPNIVEKIKFSTIGLHFYQTEPKVLYDFKENENIHFIQQTNGVFHPKTYLFWNNETDWTVLIGSANFTNGAFNGNNTESMICISSNTSNLSFFNELKDFLKMCFKQGSLLNKQQIANYCNLYPQRMKAQRVLSSSYQNVPKIETNILDIDILNYSWDRYFLKIQNDKHHGFHERLNMLKIIHRLFEQYPHFCDMPVAKRKLIAGLKTPKYSFSEWFGNMKSSGKFSGAIHQELENTDKALALISEALDFIPLAGTVDKQTILAAYEKFHSFQFIKFGKPLKPRHLLAPFTRLLSMKRPDLFFCCDGANKERIFQDFEIKPILHGKKFDIERYWDEILYPIYQTPWFNAAPPTNEQEYQAWLSRVAMIDVIYYKPKK